MAPSDTPQAATNPVGSLVESVAVVDATTTCADVDFSFRNRWTSSSILVVPEPAGGRPGLVSRSRFLTTMAGSYGYGRSLYGKRPIGELAAWDTPLLRHDATLGQAAALLVDGPDGYHDLVVVDEEQHPVGILRPVRVMQALADKTAQQAATDHLTGAASRSHIVEILATRLAEIGTGVGAVIIAYVDLDRLKAVNDGLGHSWGDALLRSVARRIGDRLAPSDILGRLGGDEFAVVRCLPPDEVDNAETLALRLGERLCAAVAAPDPTLPSQAQSRASVGVAVTTSSETSVDAALYAADQAMYQAKAAGGNSVRMAGGTDLRPTTWARSRRLEVVYQPIVDTESGRVVAVEALLRQRNKDGGLDGPAGPLDDAARAGMALDLDRWVLDRACRDMLRWHEAFGDAAPGAVNVNLAADSLNHPGLAAAVLATIDETGLAHERVRLELSERSGVADLTAALAGLDELAAAGVAIALDDLGATLDTLRVLDRLPIDAIKIDRSVVVGAGARVAIDVEVLSLLVRLGQHLGLELVGEGVEQRDDESMLQSAGVHLMQGFRYSHPVPAAEIERMTRPVALATQRTGDAG